MQAAASSRSPSPIAMSEQSPAEAPVGNADAVRRVDILLVEDNLLDTRATFNAAQKLDIAASINVVADGQAALDYLRSNGALGPAPGLILLDLNLPGKDGHDVLAEIRSDPALQTTPVVILTTSSDELDVRRAYTKGANAYITKPTDLDGWLNAVSTINDFWLSLAKLPPR